MTRKANRPEKQRKPSISREKLQGSLGGKQPFNLFGCSDCELLIFEYPDVNSINCPWCRKFIDVHVMYAYIAFAPGVQLAGAMARAVLVE